MYYDIIVLLFGWVIIIGTHELGHVFGFWHVRVRSQIKIRWFGFQVNALPDGLQYLLSRRQLYLMSYYGIAFGFVALCILSQLYPSLFTERIFLIYLFCCIFDIVFMIQIFPNKNIGDHWEQSLLEVQIASLERTKKILKDLDWKSRPKDRRLHTD
jgi:hypothetical protein